MEVVTAILIGAGQRGMNTYATYALEHPDELRFVGVCEPDEHRRAKFCEVHGIDENMAFDHWEKLLSLPQAANAVLICTQDDQHFAPAMKALDVGYHVLLEKPMSNRPEECVVLGEEAKKRNKVFSICHVLRYTSFFQELKRVLQAGAIGSLVSIQHNENVGYWHQAHSFVRGNWRKSSETSPMILAKSCHDLDILLWLADADCVNVSSFGSLLHFKPENAPTGAMHRCLDGCPLAAECPYYAPKIYIDWKDSWQGSVLRTVVTRNPEADNEEVYAALRDGPYGRCVYHCDNDVVDHQVVNLDFEGGITASFTMSAFTNESSRTLKLMGTKGEIRGHMEKSELEIIRFGSKEKEIICLNQPEKGHGGGDHGIVKDFISQVQRGEQLESLTSAAKSVQSHLMAFAAERSRLEGRTIKLADFILEYKK